MIENSAERSSPQGYHPALELAEDPPLPCQEASPLAPDAGVGPRSSLAERVRAYEIELIREALAQARGNQSEAARLLCVPRRTLAHKVLSYGLVQSRRARRGSARDEPSDD